VFITSGNGPNNNGNLGGVGGADKYCQALAEAAKLPGTYKAWLTGADAGSAPAMRFESKGFAGWYLLPTKPATPVARGWVDLTGPNEDVPGNYLRGAIVADEKGAQAAGNAWTNTSPAGEQSSLSGHCQDWSSGSDDYSGRTGRSKVDVLDEVWTNNVNALPTCGFGARLYCFQTN